MRRLTIAGFVAALTLGSFVLGASAQNPPPPPGCGPDPKPPISPTNPAKPCWPSTSEHKSVVNEAYSDFPWHQKLGTQGGNEIDEALVLPYEALGDNEKAFCKNPTDPAQQADCMIEIGVNNILGIYRIDTPYDPKYPNTYAKGKCQSNLQPVVYVLDSEHGMLQS